MNILLITIITMGTSLVMDKLATQKLYKIIADLGYKSNLNYIDDLPECVWRFSFLETIIPIYNVLIRMFKYLRLYNRQGVVLEILKKRNTIRLMDTKELKEYEANPTGTNAIKMFEKERKMKEKIQSIFMIVDGEDTKIYYQIKNNKMDIIKVEGSIKERGLSDKEIEELILNSWALMFTIGLKLEGDKFYKSLVKNKHYDIMCNPNTNSGIEEMSFNYDYNELQKMYKYFDSQPIEENKVKTLKKQ